MKSSSSLFHRGSVVMSFCILLLSCQKEESTKISPIKNSNLSDPTLEYIISLGFDKANIVNQGEYYLVDGDIKFDKKSDKGARPTHSVFNGRPIVNHDVVGNITVGVADNFGTDVWRNNVIEGTRQAISNWNSVNNSKLYFTYTTSFNADITVMYRPNLGSYYGIGAFPSNCNAGSSLDLASSTANLSVSQLRYLITHELGHCIGFRHTDEGSNQGYHVPGTPYTENGSVMNSGGATVGNTVPQWTGFSSGDLTATSIVYPSTAYADASDLSYPNTINFKWTISYFCNAYVDIAVFDGTGTNVKSEHTPNSGLFLFSTNGLTPGVTYEFQVSDPNNPNRKIYTTTSLPF